MTPGQSLKSMLVVRPTSAAGQFSIELEDFWSKPVAGDLLARLALAAYAAGESAPLLSLQTTFAPGIPAARTLNLEVRRTGTMTRFDVAAPDGELVCAATARFAAVPGGPSYEGERAPEVPDPDTLPSTLEAARAEGWPEEYSRGPFEFRRVGARVGTRGVEQPHVTWLRPREPLPRGAEWHSAALLFASEFYSHWAFEWRIGTTIDNAAYVPLEHSVWLHAAPRFDDWVLIVAKSERSANGHAVARRSLFTRDGTHIASAIHGGYISLLAGAR